MASDLHPTRLFSHVEMEAKHGSTLIDAEDWLKVCGRSWRVALIGRVSKKPYVVATTNQVVDGRRKHVQFYLHRIVMDAPKGFDVDHINGDTLDNRKSNLRLASRSQNLAAAHNFRAGPAGYRGVTALKSGRFLARCGRGHTVGRFGSAEEAARAYDAAATKKFGEFAWLNFPNKAPTCGL